MQTKSGNHSILATQRNGIGDGGDGCHLQETGQGFFAGADGVAALQDCLGQFHRNRRAAEGFLRIWAAELVWIEYSQGIGHCIAGFRQMVVGHDEIETQSAGRLGLGKGPHAGIDRDDQANAFRKSRFKHARLQPVTLLEPVRHVKADRAAEHLDGGLQQDNGSGAVHVVIAVKQNSLMVCDGAFQPLDSHCQSQHEEGIVKVGRLRVQKSVSPLCFRDATGHQQLGQHQGQASCVGQSRSLCGMRLSQGPMLTGALAVSRARQASR